MTTQRSPRLSRSTSTLRQTLQLVGSSPTAIRPKTCSIISARPGIVWYGRPNALGILFRIVSPGSVPRAGRAISRVLLLGLLFTMLGLRADSREDLIEASIENCTSLIERFGFIPNGSRTYYLGRSQPPVYYLMLDVSRALGAESAQRRLDALLREHSFWMADSESLKPGDASRRAVCMPDGNRSQSILG